MKLITGIGYDGRQPNQRISELGSLVCGEKGLVAELGFRIGLPPTSDNKVSRVMHYLNALKAADTGRRFYSASRKTDPIATAETLLAWRDWAILHGWQHGKENQHPERLEDLNAVETYFNSPTPSTGEQIHQILERLPLVASAIDEVCLHSPHSAWPALYQQLFARMKEVGIHFSEDCTNPTGKADGSSDLGKLQQALFNGDTTPLALDGDGSIKLFAASNSTLTARYAAIHSTDDNLIIAQSHQHCIENAVRGKSDSSAGLGSNSALRAPNLLLPLMLQCSWNTPSADVILQYLNLPAGKFRRLRQRLAGQFKDLPGYHLEDWQSTINQYVDTEVVDKPETDETKLRQSISDWLPLCLSSDNRSMPIEQAAGIAQHCVNYWKQRIAHAEDNESKSVFGAACNAANATQQSLQDWPDPSIDPMQLNRLVNIVQPLGQSCWHKARNVQSADIVECAQASGLRHRPINNLLWIDPQLSRAQSTPPFSQAELAGIPLAPSREQQAAIQEEALKRHYLPILLAENSITLIASSHEPDLLKLMLGALCQTSDWPTLEVAILNNHIKSASPVADITPLAPARRWNTGIKITHPRPKESFSSLNSLAIKPHEYVLRYPARLSEGSIGAVAVDARLKGNLAHRIIERWFKDNSWDGSAIDRLTIETWLHTTLPTAIREYALPLAQAGSRVERLEFHQQMLDAMDVLLRGLYRAGVVNVQTEAPLSRTSSLGQLEGNLDLLCEHPDGKLAIIDMKWGSNKRYKEELKAGRPLQLATYAHIVDGKHPGQVAGAGYFIISSAELLCNNDITFPTATVVEQDQPITLAQSWNQLEKTLQWRASQLAAGIIEISYGVILPDEHSSPPDECLPLISIENAANKKKSDYLQTFKPIDLWRNLTGNAKEQ